MIMRKLLLIAALILLSLGSVFAQQTGIEKSEEFDEPEYGWNKLLQMKNGNTMFFHGTRKNGVEVTIYDSKRKQIATKEMETKLCDLDNMKKAKIIGLYEISGEGVIFLVQADDRVPTLYRIRVNATTGVIIKEDELGQLPKTSMWQGYAMVFGGVDASDMIVEKDPNSDCYATIVFNGFAHNRSERIRVTHYDGNHKAINTAFYESPGGKFKYLRFIGAAVDGNKRLFVTTYGHNGNSSDVASRVIVSKLTVGDSNFVHNQLDFSEDFDNTQSVMRYNVNNHQLQLLTLSLVKSKHKIMSSKTETFYLTLLSYLDPESLALLNVKVVRGEKIDAYGRKNIDKDYEYSGMPQQMIINKDNTTTILSEEMKQVTVQSSHSSHTYTYLGPVGISELSDTGAELHGYAISKKQKADGTFPHLYISQRSKGIFMVSRKSNTDAFLSYDYINAPQGNYIVFNDLPGNADKDEEEENRKTVKSVSATNTMCYRLNEPKLDKFYLFGEPDGKHNSTFCYIESSDYNKEINTYATIIVERDGRSKSAKIAWIKFM